MISVCYSLEPSIFQGLCAASSLVLFVTFTRDKTSGARLFPAVSIPWVETLLINERMRCDPIKESILILIYFLMAFSASLGDDLTNSTLTLIFFLSSKVKKHFGMIILREWRFFASNVKSIPSYEIYILVFSASQ